MSRAIWKGAISFGLVHVPVGLYPASHETGIDFDWLDKRSMDPVGYKRINKRTGKEIESADIVKGIKQESGDYVVLSEDEIKAAYPTSTQTIEIETFVQADEIPFTHLETPYYLAPLAKGEKVYALLREAMREAKVIGVARVVMHTKERLAALIPDGDALILNTIRWAEEIRPRSEIGFPPANAKAGFKEGELNMAVQLVKQMTGPWKPDAYADKFSHAILALAAAHVKAGATEQVKPLEDEAPAHSGGNVVDLAALLKQSLASRKPSTSTPTSAPAKATKGGAAAKAAARKLPARKAPAAKTAARRRA